jgi:hypothetical protein
VLNIAQGIDGFWEQLMQNEKRFAEAIRLIDQANAEDPRFDDIDGEPVPRELRFARCVSGWVEEIASDPSEELLLAARAHTLRRWRIPRDTYPRTSQGYHQWRGALALFHAEQARAILVSLAYPEAILDKVDAFITKKNWPADSEACVLEDADCLAFLETKLGRYACEWEEGRTVHILQAAFRKMTPLGRQRAMKLNLGQREQELIKLAAG